MAHLLNDFGVTSSDRRKLSQQRRLVRRKLWYLRGYHNGEDSRESYSDLLVVVIGLFFFPRLLGFLDLFAFLPSLTCWHFKFYSSDRANDFLSGEPHNTTIRENKESNKGR